MIKRLLFIMSFLCVMHLHSYAQELHINDLNATAGSFQYSRGDSIYIAGDNDTVSLSDSLTMDLEGPKILIGESTSADRFSVGSFKAFYNNYEKIRVVPEIDPVYGDTPGRLLLHISGGAPPYQVDWLGGFSEKDTIRFQDSIYTEMDFNFSALLRFINSGYRSDSLNDLRGGRYTCSIQDSYSKEVFSFVVGNANALLDTTGCSESNRIFGKTTKDGWGNGCFYYGTYYPLNSSWDFGTYLTSSSSTYSLGVYDDIGFSADSLGYRYGVYMKEGVLIPVSNGNLVSDTIQYRYKAGDFLSMCVEGGDYVLKLNNKTILTRRIDEDIPVVLGGNIHNGEIGYMDLALEADPISSPYPSVLSYNVNIEETNLLCGLENSGRLCTNYPSYVTWPEGLSGDCMGGLSAGSYECIIDLPLESPRTEIHRIGYEVDWFPFSLDVTGVSGLKPSDPMGLGRAVSDQEIPDQGSHWITYKIDLDPFNTDVFLGLKNGSMRVMMHIINEGDNSICIPSFVGVPVYATSQTEFIFENDGEPEFEIRMNDQSGNKIEFLLNGQLMFDVPYFDMTGFSPYVILKCDNKLLSAVTSIPCSVSWPYYDLSKKTEGQKYPVFDRFLRFKFVEPYQTSPGYEESVYIQKMTEGNIVSEKYDVSGFITSTTVSGSSDFPGYRQMKLDFNMFQFAFQSGDEGLLELKNSKGESWYLNFVVK